MSYNQFLNDLNNNMIYENISADKICVHNHVTILNTCNNYKYDFKTDDHQTFEVKSDKARLKTNNFYIEFLGRNDKKSGISITESDYYIITDTNKYYMIKTSALKILCKNMSIRTLKDNSASGFIIPCSLIITNSIQI